SPRASAAAALVTSLTVLRMPRMITTAITPAGDPVALAKALAGFVKDNSEFTFKLAIVEGKILDVSEIDALSKLPGKEELFSKLLFLINSPAQRLATVINATGRNLAVVVNQAVEQGKFGAPAAEVAPAEAPAAEVSSPAAEVEAAHVEESAAGEQPSGAAQPENSTASQTGEAADEAPAEG
ncbi:MAG: 50S ribosomal protein L10, partial [Bryocella sp.]